ncbi:hypothetical protein [Candidimonas sp. SYP-B2681]|uniref:hypothetical protein n=1 Tax=Candidimonas sp. SYP-B2681 TaxID=2497686 RepID=UPI00351586E6
MRQVADVAANSTLAVHDACAALAYRARLGLEMEMVVAHAGTGVSHPVESYFDALSRVKQDRGDACRAEWLSGRCVGIETPTAHCGLDNGFNLLETATAPVDAGPLSLERLDAQAHQELADTLDALQHEQACVLNVAQHPDCPRDPDWYARVCVPRPIYQELVSYRGWHHWVGIDAKAQNGPNTSAPVLHAAQSLNVVLGLAAASIALFGNSPLESGSATGLKENRLTIWPRVFKPARFAGDALLTEYPSRPFRDLGDYFRWMFQPGTVTRSLPLDHRYDYKSAPTVIPDRDPSLTEVLHAARWPGRRSDNGQEAVLIPHAMHFEHSQIAQFLDARWRYRLHTLPAMPELLAAWREEGGLESLFAACGVDGYIEGRAAGAGFADACLIREAGAAVARHVLIGPSALQLGILGNLEEATQLVQDWGWQTLGMLRQAAMQHGMADARVRALCSDVLAVAHAGLPAHSRQHLAYADHVLESGRSAADRLLDTWNSVSQYEDRLQRLLPHHAALHPSLFI